MAIVPPAEERRITLCEWLTVHGIDINAVPRYEHDLRIEERDGQRFIHYTEYVLTDDGRKQADPDKPEEALKRSASVPWRVDPPAWLNIPGGTS